MLGVTAAVRLAYVVADDELRVVLEGGTSLVPAEGVRMDFDRDD